MSKQMLFLSKMFRVRRRYARSINLERDLAAPGTLEGYLVSPLALDATERVLGAWATPNAPKAWTITGVYGTGKSAYAHFLCACMAPADSSLRRDAFKILRSTPEGAAVARRLRAHLPKDGILLAVATGQREPLALTVLRALHRGAQGLRNDVMRQASPVVARIEAALADVAASGHVPAGSAVVDLALDLARASEGGLFLILDELGKCLEYAARDTSGSDDVFLLQQLAESTVGEARLGVIGLLHQGFGEYGARLAMDRRTEWLKVQGRFEDVVFTQPPEQMLRLMASAIESSTSPETASCLKDTATRWRSCIASLAPDHYVEEVLSNRVIQELLPLHPVAALILPSLCSKYAQNDRSLFTFLASQEPHAFGRFLRDTAWDGSVVPLQRLDDVYDYFAGIAGQAMGARPQFQRWAEVHAVVSDARNLDPRSAAAIKTIATLNLTAASGPLRASRALVLAALVGDPDSADEVRGWEGVLDTLVSRGLITYRRQLDEYRLWEGSDFDVETAIRARLSTGQVRLAEILSAAVPLAPIAAQRHSYRTGTLRFFERLYADEAASLTGSECQNSQSDGLLIYWIGPELPAQVPSQTSDGRPVIVVEARELAVLADAAAEFLALEEISRSDPHLQADGVARREVRHRQRIAREALDRAVRESLFGGTLRCHVAGEACVLTAAALRARLSEVCDRVYPDSLVLWNELINRRDLTSQGAKARRELIEVMLKNGARPRLGLEGNGPETSMYASVLERSGIHRQETDRWVFGSPSAPGFTPVWAAMVQLCQDASDSPQSVESLFQMLQRPPYGVKAGVLPVLLTAALLAHGDSLSLYREGSFLPSLGAEHFEILVKHPGKFAIKHFALDGLRGEVFNDLEEAVRNATRQAEGNKEPSLLGVVRPLVRFAAALPQLTLNTRALSGTAAAVRDALLSAREPDLLLFQDLPTACDLAPIAPGQESEPDFRVEFRTRLLGALRELQSFRDRRRGECQALLHAAFGLGEDPARLRSDLQRRVRALGAGALEERLQAFIVAAGDDSAAQVDWLDALIMVVSDRPLRNWNDEDAAEFESRASEFARRFRNLESLHTEAGPIGSGDDVRRVTITGADGRDLHRVVWLSTEDQPAIARATDHVLDQLDCLSPAQREAVLALLAERILANGSAAPTESTSPPPHDSPEPLYAEIPHA